MQEDPVVSDFVTKMLHNSPVTRPRATDLISHQYVLNFPKVRVMSYERWSGRQLGLWMYTLIDVVRVFCTFR